MPTVHLLVKGRVQGVFYRASAKNLADSLGITGWVRNTDDGDVEILASGPEEDLAAFKQWCKQGPPRAIVTSLGVTQHDKETVFGSFDVVRG